MGSDYGWQEGVLEGRKRDEMVFNSLAYNQTNKRVKKLDPNRRHGLVQIVNSTYIYQPLMRNYPN